MVKRSRYIIYIIGLIIIICISLFIQSLKISILEGATATNSSKDNFTVYMNVKTYNSQGKIVPYPLGSYKLTTTSGKYSETRDFSMNVPLKIKTNYDVNASNNIVNRIINISPSYSNMKIGECTHNINICNSFANQFEIDISFNEIEYKLNSMADLIARNLPSTNLNFIDDNNNLLITAIGTIYDKNKTNIGEVSMDGTDSNNQKSYVIKLANPNDINYKIKNIIITFIFPIPLTDMSSLGLPPAASPAVMSKLKQPDPDSIIYP